MPTHLCSTCFCAYSACKSYPETNIEKISVRKINENKKTVVIMYLQVLIMYTYFYNVIIIITIIIIIYIYYTVLRQKHYCEG